jgi:uncharacterized protein (UPF0147 family)
MKKEIKFSISESLHTELQGIVAKKKIDENQIIEQIISDFITKQNIQNDKENIKSIEWSENSNRIFDCCSWIKDSMKDELISNDLFFIQIAYQRIIRNMSLVRKDSDIYTPPSLAKVNALFENANRRKFSSYLATMFYDTKLEFEINEFNSMISLLSNLRKINKIPFDIKFAIYEENEKIKKEEQEKEKKESKKRKKLNLKKTK